MKLHCLFSSGVPAVAFTSSFAVTNSRANPD